jgi:hypothetical protein
MAKDPVCGMFVEEKPAVVDIIFSLETEGFCTNENKLMG